DYLLDLHCGDGNEALRPYVYQTVTGDSTFDERIAALVAHCGFDHIVVDRGRPKDPAASVFCSNTAITRGKPAGTVEGGRPWRPGREVREPDRRRLRERDAVFETRRRRGSKSETACLSRSGSRDHKPGNRDSVSASEAGSKSEAGRRAGSHY